MRTRFKLDEGIDNRGPVFERLANEVRNWRFEPESMPPQLLANLLGPPDWQINSYRLRGYAYWYRDEQGIASVFAFLYVGDHHEHLMVADVEETRWNPSRPYPWWGTIAREWPEPPGGFEDRALSENEPRP
jgi:hypothetical protein